MVFLDATQKPDWPGFDSSEKKWKQASLQQ